MSHIYACPVCERQYTVSSAGNYLCDCGAIFFCPELPEDDMALVTQGIHRKDIKDKSAIKRFGPENIVQKKHVPPRGNAKEGSGSFNKRKSATGSHNKRKLEGSDSLDKGKSATGSYNKRKLEGSGSFKRKSPVSEVCPFAKGALLCAVVAAFFSPLALCGTAGLLPSPLLCAASLILAFMSKSLLSDPRYDRKGLGLITCAVCLSALAILIWMLAFYYVKKEAARSKTPPPVEKVYIK